MRRSLLVPATTVRGLPSDEVGDGDSLSNPEDASSGNMRLEVRGDGEDKIVVIEGGRVRNEAILTFQGRSAEYPYPPA